ncbi:MAG TPA: helix-turn-helix domain-containing protein [Chitinophaga sp.]|uniref:helix-turn-helix transcriptional regulator n=1 Tax=Chitinophaga sp. TaxID=1869181 RepID=UPI002CE746D6|nr:helix-turn-helix domain-containing protein [Chitinophaga sp.]HVI46417.1 helix-turn-helix domain-containing protein [Chitinophaga sp.]
MAIILSPGIFFGEEKKVHENAFFRMNIAHYDPYTDIREHHHENAYLSLLIKGDYHEKNRKEQHTLASGEFIFRPAGYNHANHFMDRGGSCLNIEFKQDILQQHELYLSFPEKATRYKVGTFTSLYKLLYCFIKDIDNGMPEDYIINWLADNKPGNIALRLPWLPQAIHILETEFDVHHSIRSLSERVHVHPVYLARAFKERTGFTPGEYQLKMRVQRTMELLFSTNLSVTQIAYAAGFSDTAHMIRSFRLFYPFSPHKFRMSLKS